MSIVLLAVSYLDYSGFIGSLDIRWHKSFYFILLQYCVVYVRSLLLHIEFRIGLSISAEYLSGILTEIMLNLYIKSERTGILIPSPPIHEHGISGASASKSSGGGQELH
jgi:hypothetical protein